MLKFGVLGDVVTEFIKMSFYAWDRLSVFHLVIEDQEQWMGSTEVVHVVPTCPGKGMPLRMYMKRDMVAVGVARARLESALKIQTHGDNNASG